MADSNPFVTAVSAPASRLDDVRELESQFLLSTYDRIPLLAVEGKGVWLYDADGRRYLDFLSGIGVNALGYAHPRISRVLREQGRRLIHLSNVYFHEYQGQLAARLARMAGMERAFFANSGAEAIETALKLARLHGHAISPGKNEIVALENSFHGRTCGALSITGQDKYRQPFEPLLPGVRFVPFNDQDRLREAVNDNTCAIMLECIQGEGGIFPADAAFLALAAELGRQHQALLIFDEIQSGLGRTGKWFAYQASNVLPDLVTLAKPIAAGYPLSCVLARGSAATRFQPGLHGTTFGGGPLACRLALEFLDIVEQDKLLENVQAMGDQLRQGLEEIVHRNAMALAVRGQGLMLSLQLDQPARPVVDQARQMGLLINATHDSVVRLLPPFNIESRHARQALKILARALRAVQREKKNAAGSSA